MKMPIIVNVIIPAKDWELLQIVTQVRDNLLAGDNPKFANFNSKIFFLKPNHILRQNTKTKTKYMKSFYPKDLNI